MEHMSPHISIDRDAVSAFCQRHHITRLALFGSVLRDDFGPDSDVDVLFVSDHIPVLIKQPKPLISPEPSIEE